MLSDGGPVFSGPIPTCPGVSWAGVPGPVRPSAPLVCRSPEKKRGVAVEARGTGIGAG